MDFIRMNCPMAVLTEETKTSEVSERPSAAFIPFSHPSGFILMKSKMAFGRKIKKIRLPQSFREKFCLLKARKIFRPSRASVYVATHHRGFNTPVCNLLPLRGFPLLHKVASE